MTREWEQITVCDGHDLSDRNCLWSKKDGQKCELCGVLLAVFVTVEMVFLAARCAACV